MLWRPKLGSIFLCHCGHSRLFVTVAVKMGDKMIPSGENVADTIQIETNNQVDKNKENKINSIEPDEQKVS